MKAAWFDFMSNFIYVLIDDFAVGEKSYLSLG